MILDSRQQKLFLLVNEYFKKNKPSQKNKQDSLHDIDHIIRVLYWTDVLAKKEKGDRNILVPAALLHDIAMPEAGDDEHARKGSEMCKSFLRKSGYTADEIEKISNIILTHSTDDPNPPETIEGCILFDADKLDTTGHIALHRWFFEYQKRGILHHEAVKKTLMHIEKWKKRYGKGIFFTESARNIGKKRMDYIIKSSKEILKDLEKFKNYYDLLG